MTSLLRSLARIWYHSHTDTFEQEPRGLFAALIIEPRNRSHYDHDYTLVYFDDYNKSQTAGQIVWQRIQQSFGREVPPPVMVNGK